MRILITGANGFIGRNLSETLEKQHELFKLSHKDTDLTDKDGVFKAFKDFKPDAVYHCAAKPNHRMAKDRENITYTNLLMFSNIYEVSLQTGVKRFITFGSGSEFDMSKSVDMALEEDFGKNIPKDETGFPRFVINKLLQGSPIGVNLRCFGVYGKYEDYTFRFISNAIIRALCGKDIVINENKNFSYIFINDLVQIAEAFLNKPLKFNDYNCVPNETVTMREIADLIIDETKSPSKIEIKGSGNDYTGSNRRLLSELDMNFTDLKDGIAILTDYYKKNFDKLDKSLI